ncbi:hypothetical protein [Thermus tengchongensis]|uniref:hypothetical protein n=1 Tax=Thermus tengchongensis TaxID=1214928 RepID=UPI001F10884E|nr:hypothetical protein [Thermus tengchongensis]
MLRLAWRNLWRTPGRSLTTGGVVALVVFLSLVFLSVYAGAFDAFFRLLLERTGHLVVRVEGYGEKEDLESLAFAPPALPLPSGARVEGVVEGGVPGPCRGAEPLRGGHGSGARGLGPAEEPPQGGPPAGGPGGGPLGRGPSPGP